MKEKDIDSLKHTTWRCQYHIVFAPKYRRMVVYGQIKQDIGQILRRLCEQKGIEIIEAQACPDHIHMLLSIPAKYSVSQIMGYLKGKKQLNDFRLACQSQIQIRRSAFLGKRLLRGHSGTEQKADSGIHQTPT